MEKVMEESTSQGTEIEKNGMITSSFEKTASMQSKIISYNLQALHILIEDEFCMKGLSNHEAQKVLHTLEEIQLKVQNKIENCPEEGDVCLTSPSVDIPKNDHFMRTIPDTDDDTDLLGLNKSDSIKSSCDSFSDEITRPMIPSSTKTKMERRATKGFGISFRSKTKIQPHDNAHRYSSTVGGLFASPENGATSPTGGRFSRFRKRPLKDNVEKAAEEAFRLIDANGDGFLQKEEVLQAVIEMKRNNFLEADVDPMEMTETMISEVDKDGDGQIDMKEFVEMMRRNSNNIGQIGNRMTMLAKNILLAHQRKLEKNIIGDDLWMINPTEWKHAVWDMFVSILIMITVVTMPLTIAWDEMNEKCFVMNVTFDLIFLLDVCKTFCTGFVDDNDAVIMDAKVVRNHYLTGFFVTDVVSSIPLDLIFKIVGVEASESVSGTKQTLKMLKLLRLAKLFRLLRLSRLFRYIKMVFIYVEESLHIRVSDGFIKLLRLAVGALFLAHWIGCFNFMLVRLHDFPSDSWVVYANLQDRSAYSQWSWSFFKALAQMIMIGFETPPFTNASCDTTSDWCSIEHWITLACLYLGAVFYSLLISSISSIIQTASLASRHFEEKLIQLDDYMRSRKLPAPLREKVKDYFHLQHTDGKLFNEREILEMVTPVLRREIQEYNGRGVAEKVPLLSSVSHKLFANELAAVIQSTIAFTDEILIKEGSIGDEMYFVNSGVLDIYVSDEQSNAYCTIGDGCFFGEVSILLSVRRTASVRTRTQCILYKVTKENLLNVLQDFPETEAKLQEVARSRKRRLDNYLHPNEVSLLSTDDEVDSEDRRTELFGLDAEKVVTTKAEDIENNRRFARIKKRPTYYNNRSRLSKPLPNPINSSQLRCSGHSRQVMENMNIV